MGSPRGGPPPLLPPPPRASSSPGFHRGSRAWRPGSRPRADRCAGSTTSSFASHSRATSPSQPPRSRPGCPGRRRRLSTGPVPLGPDPGGWAMSGEEGGPMGGPSGASRAARSRLRSPQCSPRPSRSSFENYGSRSRRHRVTRCSESLVRRPRPPVCRLSTHDPGGRRRVGVTPRGSGHAPRPSRPAITLSDRSGPPLPLSAQSRVYDGAGALRT